MPDAKPLSLALKTLTYLSLPRCLVGSIATAKGPCLAHNLKAKAAIWHLMSIYHSLLAALDSFKMELALELLSSVSGF
jgi:hypothetical protein